MALKVTDKAVALPPSTAETSKERAHGGADHVEKEGGYTGAGLRGHVLEGVNRHHPDFASTERRHSPMGVGRDSVDEHGTNTFGVVYGSGVGNPRARGILPDAEGVYTARSAIYGELRSRYELTQMLIERYEIMFQTASWGHEVTEEYTEHSSELDRLIFELDIPVTQSQGNEGSTESRPEAWAKNVISVGAVRHHDNDDPGDDSWKSDRSKASVGPARDGRVKPDLIGYYDSRAATTSLLGYVNDFGATSAATPMVNGYAGLVVQMWTDGIFGNQLPHPWGDDSHSRFLNRPHFSTVKALLIASARQYPFSGRDHDLARTHQGWGFPDVKRLFETRDRLFVVNEDDVLAGGQTQTYQIEVKPGEPELKVTMVYPDPPAEPGAEVHRVNDLDLKITAPDGTVYWGNHGLLDGTHSVPGGTPDRINTVENVFVDRPQPGTWTVEVIAASLAEDGHTETPELDADFALVALGARKVSRGC